jgi:hypothetical protein
MKTKLIAAVFVGMPCGDRAVECYEVLERHGGEIGDCGTMLGTLERVVECDVPADRVRACVRELQQRGFRVVVGRAALRRYYEDLFAPSPPTAADTS